MFTYILSLFQNVVIISNHYLFPAVQSVQNCEEPMTEVTGFQQSVRLFQSYDPVTPSILSSFLLHLSDALPSGRVLLRLSVIHPYADSPTAVQAF